ncbi:hypothetical protein GPECTOR_5g222 [Gonium pectorale]|uniref:RING-type E3 ubiquitin transferase n=1 Tax=Gonium pectorale TaxID=33097 RepID=A0A150GW95_GONPE|nr:hypothetical protein GPECTOR_5g222 [Gonium pectorale]|eukprot:KXZ54121.1 hypothetical protein GPECTOR_5g222 [Gonium pectorale]
MGDPSQLSSGERADHVAAELQAAFGGPGSASDVQRVCSLLSLLRQQFSEQAPKNWPADTVKRLWQSIIGALRVAQAPEVQVAACAAVEALGQSCSSCTDLDRELSVVEDAVSVVIDTIQSAGSLHVRAIAIRALLSLSGCLNCRCYYDKPTQEILGSRGAVQVLLSSLPLFLAEAAAAQQQQADGGAAAAGTAQPQQQQAAEQGDAAGQGPERPADECAAAVADIFRALHYTCLLNAANTATLAAEGGYALVVKGLAVMSKDLNVQEHGAMLLAELACTPGLGGREVLESIVTVANIARLQLQEKYIEVARAAVWSLGRLASYALAPLNGPGSQPSEQAGAGEPTAASPDSRGREPGQAQAWALLSDPVLRVVVSMLQSCHMQDDPLVKHCLDYIAVLASAAPFHHSGQAPADRSGDGVADGAGAAAGGGTLLPLMRLATEAVLATARAACDVRLQAVVLRTLHVVLLRFPGAAALHLAPRQAEVLEVALRMCASARQALEQQQAQQLLQQQQAAQHPAPQHAHAQALQQAQANVYASKDLFLVHLYALTVSAAMTDAAALGAGAGAPATVLAAATASTAAGSSSAAAVFQGHVLTSLACVVRHLSEGGGGEAVSYEQPPAATAEAAAAAAAAAAASIYLTVGCCRYACHCCFIHDPIRGAEVLAAVRSAARLLVWCSGADGVNAADRDGCGALHILAAGGTAPLLAAFIEEAGPALDFLRRTRAGLNALQLARVKKHAPSVQLLELATESAAKAAQDALLRELEAEGSHHEHSQPGSKRPGAAGASGAGAGRHHKAASGSSTAGAGGVHDSSPHHNAALGAPPPPGESEEARRAREELERKRRAAEEEYEAALEQRRRQLEEEARQEEARLIELAQAESLRMATPPPQPPQSPPQLRQQAGPAASAPPNGLRQQLEQASAAPQALPLATAAGGPFESSVQASAAAVASGAQLPPGMAHILTQLAVDQQQQQHQGGPAAAQQQQQQLLGPLIGQPNGFAAGPGGSLGPRASLSSADEQVSMPHGGGGGGASGGALGMRRVVSKSSFISDDPGIAPGHLGGSSGGALQGPTGSGGLGALGGLGNMGHFNSSDGGGGGGAAATGFPGYAGSFGNLLTAGGGGGHAGLPGMGMDSAGLLSGALAAVAGGNAAMASPGALSGPLVSEAGSSGVGGLAAGVLVPGPESRAGHGDGSVYSDSLGGSIDGGLQLHGSGGPAGLPQPPGGGWHRASGASFGGAPPAAFLHSGPPPPPPPHPQADLQHGGGFLPPQGAGLDHPSAHQPQPRMPSGGGGVADGWMGQRGGGGSHADVPSLAAAADVAARQRLMGGGMLPVAPSPPSGGGDRGMPLADALLAAGAEMWELAEEATRGPSRQLWLGNVHAGLPAANLQALCQQFGPVQDAVVAPGTLSAVVLFARGEDASRAAHALHGRDIPHLSYEGKPLVVRYCRTGPSPGQQGDAAAGLQAPPAAPSGGAGGEGSLGLGLPPGLEAALSAAGFGPGALEAAMQGLLPPDQQQALHAVLLQATAAGNAAAAAPPPQQAPQRQQHQQPHQQQHRGLGGMQPGSAHHGSMPHLAGLVGAGGSVGDFGSMQPSASLGHFPSIDQPHGGGGGGLYGGPDDADGHGGGGQGSGVAGGSTGGGPGSTSGDVDGVMGLDGENAADVPEGKPSRHLWLGNIPLKPNKLAMELLFARFGPLESVRVFPGKTFAFVNYLAPQHAVAAKTALDGQPAPSVTGSKPMVIRYQKDTSTVPANLGMAGGKSMSRSSSTQNLTGLTAAASLARLLDEDLPPEPAVNLSNKLNPNNIHYDRELAARYKRMSKAEKEALWAQDRAMQALGANAAAAAAAVNAGAAGIAGLLDPTNAAAARLLAQAGLGGLAAGLGGGPGSDFLLPRVMSAGALDYLAAGGAAGHGGGAAVGGGGHGGLFRVNTTQSLLGMQQAANAAMLLPQMGAAAAGGLQGLLGQHAAAAAAAAGAAGLDGAAQALQQQLQAAQQQALQQQLHQQAFQQQLQQLAAAAGLGGGAVSNAALAAAVANAFGGDAAAAAPKRLQPAPQGRMVGVGSHQNLAAMNPLMDPAAAAALVGGLQGLGGGGGPAAALPQGPGAAGPGMARPAFKQIPPSFLCPLTRQLMSDPVVAADGITYNRPAIAEWLRQHDASPVTRQPLANKMLTPNVALRNAIINELGFATGPA